MADRRMFTKKIIDSDLFLDMPLSTQVLYFHLAMRADDDGFINNPRKIQRMICATDDDMRILMAKQFLLSFETGVVVIKHWRMHNAIRKDRYTQTHCIDELRQLETTENGAYEIASGKTGQQAIQAPEVVEAEIVEAEITPVKKEPKKRHGEFNHVTLTDEQYNKLIAEYGESKVKAMIQAIDEWVQLKGKTYKDYNLAIRKWIKNESTQGNTGTAAKRKSEFTDYEQRETNYSDIEKSLRGF